MLLMRHNGQQEERHKERKAGGGAGLEDRSVVSVSCSSMSTGCISWASGYARSERFHSCPALHFHLTAHCPWAAAIETQREKDIV